jgi:hypothetical protein
MILLTVLSSAVACGSSGGEADPDAGQTDGCQFASTRYLPYEAGNWWRWRVTDVNDPALMETKRQEIAAGSSADTFVQTTTKANGKTVSDVKVTADTVMQLLQKDLSPTDVVERVTTYAPGKLRIDESAAHTMAGAAWDESFTETEMPTGGAQVSETITERWTVVGVDVDCAVPAGAFKCLHLRRVRIVGGPTGGEAKQKEFYFARGVGKVKETGGQTEELLECGKK